MELNDKPKTSSLTNESPVINGSVINGSANNGYANNNSTNNGSIVLDSFQGRNIPLDKQLVKEFRPSEFASALISWTNGPMPDIVVYTAAACSPYDAAKAILRVSPKNAKSGQNLGGVVDVGANRGYLVTKLALQNNVKWILSIEPDKRNFKPLSKLQTVRNSHTNFVAVHGAASDHQGRLKMLFHKKRTDFTCASCLKENQDNVYTRFVDSWTLDGLILENQAITTARAHRDYRRGEKSLLRERKTVDHGQTLSVMDSIVLLKTDTQGHEREVLFGASRLFKEGRVMNLIVEFDTKLLRTRKNARSLIQFILAAGLQCTHLRFSGKTKSRSSPRKAPFESSADSLRTVERLDKDGDVNLNPVVRNSQWPFARALSQANVDEFIDFVRETGKYTDLFCSKRPPSKETEGSPLIGHE